MSFDLDDTLWDCEPAIVAAENALYEWHQKTTPEITEHHDPASLREFRATYYRAHPELHACVTTLRLQGLRELLAEFGVSESLAEEGFAVFYKARSNVRLYDGALQLLSDLGQRYKIAAITNGNADLHMIGIAGYFDLVYAANLATPPKPEPDMFLQCLDKWGIEAETLLHIGDNPITDVTGGHNAGVQTMWFNQYNVTWPAHLEPPHFEVQSVQDIASLLR